MDSVTLPRAPTTIGIVCTRFSPQHFFNSISRSLYLVIFSASFLTMFWHTGIATSIIIHSFFSSSCMMMSGLFAPTFLSVLMYESHRMFSLLFVVISVGLWSSHLSVVSMPASRRMFQCRYFATWLCLCRYCVPASILHPDTI